MAVELAEVAAGLPMAASLALAGGITTFREGRRRGALNEAMHELRRPLQVLALALPDRLPDDTAVDSSLRLASAALDRLDREVNGSDATARTELISPRPLLEEAVLRWQARAVRSGGCLALSWGAGEAAVVVDPIGFANALDNLISNAIEHGGGPVTVAAWVAGLSLSVAVHDCGAGGEGRLPPRPRRSGRHGHGLRLVARFAGDHGGRFDFRRGDAGAVATIRLPLALAKGGR